MRGEVTWQPRALAVANESKLDLSSLECAMPAPKERGLGIAGLNREMGAQEPRGIGKQDLLAPRSSLEPADEQSTPIQIRVPTA